jgi:hypothetical protein
MWNPKCPRSGQTTVLQKVTRAPHPAYDQLIFRCTACNTEYATQDRVQLGPRALKSSDY